MRDTNDTVSEGAPLEPAFRLWEAVCGKEPNQPFRIVYEDDQVIVCRKAPGVPVQSASPRVKDLESMLKKALLDRAFQKGAHAKVGGPGGIPEDPYLGVVHRLDQPVQGLLAFAKTPGAAAALSRQVQQGTLVKEYLCVCRREHVPAGFSQKGTCTDYLVRDGRTNLSRVVSGETPGAKRAVLDYEVLETKGDWLLVKVCLHTGRHHQIRVQLAHLGIPIAGDQKYGTVSASHGELKLCAYHLGFTHPKTGRRMDFCLESSDRKEELYE